MKKIALFVLAVVGLVGFTKTAFSAMCFISGPVKAKAKTPAQVSASKEIKHELTETGILK